MVLKRLVSLAAAASSALMISSVNAADSGFYVGAGAGQAHIKDQAANPNGSGTIDFDAKSTAYRAFAGYRLKAIPIIDLAGEAGYINFGNPSRSSQGQNVEYKLQGAELAGLLIFPLGPVDFFGKAGALYSSVDRNIGGTSSSRTSTSPVYGAGVGFRLGRFGVRAEYEYFDVSNLNRLQMFSVSGLIQF
jgi:hypothetical protein